MVRGPQVLIGYWGNEKAYRESFAEIDGKRFFRTGDLGRTDEDGYFFISDRLKRMINAAGFKVWPAEVEAAMYQHPAIKECCIIASPDERRGETVKAVVVLKPGAARQRRGDHRLGARPAWPPTRRRASRVHGRAAAHRLRQAHVARAAGSGEIGIRPEFFLPK